VGSNPTLSAIDWVSMVARIGSFATTCRESRQARKGATVTVRSGAEGKVGAGRLHLIGKSA
jgi:hypothetical protein